MQCGTLDATSAAEMWRILACAFITGAHNRDQCCRNGVNSLNCENVGADLRFALKNLVTAKKIYIYRKNRKDCLFWLWLNE